MASFDDLLNDIEGGAAPQPVRSGMVSMEDRAAQRVKVRQLKKLLALFLKAGKTLRLYSDDHKYFDTFTKQFIDGLEEWFGEGLSSLTLEITPRSINWEGHVVFENPEQRENLAFKLYRDGMRLLQFRRGATPDELREFVELVAREIDGGSASKDLSVLFWEGDFKHIQMAIAETFVDYDESALAMLQDVDEQLENYERAFELTIAEGMRGNYTPAGAPAGEGEDGGGEGDEDDEDDDAPIPDIPPEALSDEAMEQVYEDLHGLEDPYASFDEVGTVLAEVVIAETNPEELRTLLENLDHGLSTLLATASIGPLNKVLRRLSLIARDAERTGHWRARVLRQFLLQIGTADRLALVARAVNTDWSPALRGDLFTFVSLQHPKALNELMRFLGNLRQREARKVVTDALLLLADRDAKPFLSALSSPRGNLAADAIHALHRIDDPTHVDPITGAFSRPEAEVRLAVIEALRPHQSPRIHKMAIEALEDEDSRVRLEALRYVTVYKIADAVPKMVAALRAKDFDDRPFDERRGWYLAMGRVAGAAAIPAFRKRTDPALGGSESTPAVLLGLIGIKATQSPEGRKYLHQFSSQAKGDLRRVVTRIVEGKK